jgi:signal peptidase II
VTPKARVFLALTVPLVLADCTTKQLVLAELDPHMPLPIVGDYLRFTLAFNPDAAFGFTLGVNSRWAFGTLAVIAIGLMLRFLRDTAPADRVRAAALALVAGGAAGNLLDRLRTNLGVVDFIDVGIGPHRFYVFNLADMAVCTGALLLALAMWRSPRDDERPLVTRP